MPIIKNIGRRDQFFSDERISLKPGESTDKLSAAICMKMAKDTSQWEVSWEDCKFREGKKLYLSASIPVHPTEGYGIYSIASLLGLEKAGIHVSSVNHVPATMRVPFEKLYPGIIELIEKEEKYPTKWGIAWGYPVSLTDLPTPKRILSTMFESTKVPEEWDKHLPMADIIIVPAESQIQIFRDSGCKQPIHVVRIGIDVSEYTYIDRPINRPDFTFVSWARMSSRKCPNEMMVAFWKAFPKEKDVRLIMKTRNHDFGAGRIGIPRVDDPRITIIDAEWDTNKLVELCHNADAGCFLSHGEGFYMPPVQAMATGLPIIGPTHSGCSAWSDPKYCYPVGLDKKNPIIPSPLGFRGGKSLDWWNMDYEEVSRQMRYLYDNRDEGREKGKKASEWVRKTFSYDMMIKDLLKVLKTLK